MNLLQLRTSAKQRFQDQAGSDLIEDDEWDEYANEADNEACRRARLLTDSTTSAICSIAVVAGTASYALDSRIIFVRRVKLASKSDPIRKIRLVDLDDQVPGWESATGEIERYCLDYQKGKLLFYRNPTASTTATLTVVRAPLAAMVNNTDEPEAPARSHPALVHWMLRCAYLKDDEEVQDEKKAAKHEALFEQEFGPKSTAIEETWINENHGYDNDEGLF